MVKTILEIGTEQSNGGGEGGVARMTGDGSGTKRTKKNMRKKKNVP